MKKLLPICMFIVSSFASISTLANDTLITSSGIKYIRLNKGNGVHPNTKQTVKVIYCRRSSTGQVVELNESTKPFKFKVGQHKVIDGFNEIVKEMSEGEQLYCIIPPELGHGKAGKKRDDITIEPNSTLYYYIQVLDIQ